MLKGIDRTFEKWHSRKHKVRLVNGLAYCAQEVLDAARQTDPAAGRPETPGFSAGEIAAYLRGNAALLRQAAASAVPELGRVLEQTAESLEQLAASQHSDLQALEQRLTALEERMRAAALQIRSEEDLFQYRRQMDRELAPYRSKMTAEHLTMLGKQYLDRRILEAAGLPRLSLFYL